MAVFIVSWPYLLTTKPRCLQKNNIGHTKEPPVLVVIRCTLEGNSRRDGPHHVLEPGWSVAEHIRGAKESSINNVGNLEWGVVKNWLILLTDSTKKLKMGYKIRKIFA